MASPQAPYALPRFYDTLLGNRTEESLAYLNFTPGEGNRTSNGAGYRKQQQKPQQGTLTNSTHMTTNETSPDTSPVDPSFGPRYKSLLDISSYRNKNTNDSLANPSNPSSSSFASLISPPMGGPLKSTRGGATPRPYGKKKSLAKSGFMLLKDCSNDLFDSNSLDSVNNSFKRSVVVPSSHDTSGTGTAEGMFGSLLTQSHSIDTDAQVSGVFETQQVEQRNTV